MARTGLFHALSPALRMSSGIRNRRLIRIPSGFLRIEAVPGRSKLTNISCAFGPRRGNACPPRADGPPLHLSRHEPVDRSRPAGRGGPAVGTARRQPGGALQLGEADHGTRRRLILNTSGDIHAYAAGVSSALPGCGRRRKSALPLVTFKIVVAIHWEALRLWLKGARLVNRPAAAANTILAAGKRNDYTGAELPAAVRRKLDPRGSALVH